MSVNEVYVLNLLKGDYNQLQYVADEDEIDLIVESWTKNIKYDKSYMISNITTFPDDIVDIIAQFLKIKEINIKNNSQYSKVSKPSNFPFKFLIIFLILIIMTASHYFYSCPTPNTLHQTLFSVHHTPQFTDFFILPATDFVPYTLPPAHWRFVGFDDGSYQYVRTGDSISFDNGIVSERPSNWLQISTLQDTHCWSMQYLYKYKPLFCLQQYKHNQSYYGSIDVVDAQKRWHNNSYFMTPDLPKCYDDADIHVSANFEVNINEHTEDFWLLRDKDNELNSEDSMFGKWIYNGTYDDYPIYYRDDDDISFYMLYFPSNCPYKKGMVNGRVTIEYCQWSEFCWAMFAKSEGNDGRRWIQKMLCYNGSFWLHRKHPLYQGSAYGWDLNEVININMSISKHLPTMSCNAIKWKYSLPKMEYLNSSFALKWNTEYIFVKNESVSSKYVYCSNETDVCLEYNVCSSRWFTGFSQMINRVQCDRDLRRLEGNLEMIEPVGIGFDIKQTIQAMWYLGDYLANTSMTCLH